MKIKQTIKKTIPFQKSNKIKEKANLSIKKS